jgi:hypothetical protein
MDAHFAAISRHHISTDLRRRQQWLPVASGQASRYSAARSMGERRFSLPPKAQFHPKTLRQKDHGTGELLA